MARRRLTPDQLLKVLLALVGFALAFQGRMILGRLDRLEAQVHTLTMNQVKILTTLNVAPCGLHAPNTLEIGVKTRVLPASGGNQENQTWEKSGVDSCVPDGIMVGYRVALEM